MVCMQNAAPRGLAAGRYRWPASVDNGRVRRNRSAAEGLQDTTNATPVAPRGLALLVLGVVLVVGALIVAINALVDALRAWMDPRLRDAG